MSIFQVSCFLVSLWFAALGNQKEIRETEYYVLPVLLQDNMAKMAERIEGDHLGLLENLDQLEELDQKESLVRPVKLALKEKLD